MFFVFNKDKIVSCVIAISTVIILFLMANVLVPTSDSTIETNASEEKLLPIYSVKTPEKKVALTINCAWSSEDIDLILKTLDENQVKVTFFMVGDWIEKNKDAAKKIYEAGHEIGNHSYSHPHVNNMTYDQNLAEIKKCSELIKSITGEKCKLYRGPYGEYNNTVIKAAQDYGCKVIQWNIDSLDWKGLTEEQIWERIEPKLENGSIILMHNGTENTALALNNIIKKIKEKGYEVGTVSSIIYEENYKIDSNGKQYSKGD